MRSNVLPNEFETLKELYLEAAFYKLEGLQKAIENLPLEEVKNLGSQITGTFSGQLENSGGPIDTAIRGDAASSTVFNSTVIGR